MTSAAVISLVCGFLWAGLFYFAIRHRDAWTVLVVLLAWTVNGLLGSGLTLEGGVVRIFSTGLVCLLLADRLTQTPGHVKRIAGAQVADARTEAHDALSDARAWEARAIAYRRLLEQHGIQH